MKTRGKQITIGALEKNQADYWDIINAGFKDAAKKLEIKVKIRAPVKENLSQQTKLMEELITEQVDGIAFVATTSDFLNMQVRKVLDVGIPVICFDLDAPRSGRFLFIGTVAPYELGVLAGRKMAELLDGEGKVAIQTGSLIAEGAKMKMKGFESVIKQTNIKVVTIENDFEDFDKAYSLARKILTDYPDLDGFYGVYAHHGPAGAKALVDTRKVGKIKIVCFDMLPDTIQWIQKGVIQTSFWISEYYYGYYSAAILYMMIKLGVNEVLTMLGLDKEHLTNNTLTLPVVPYTKENVQDFIKWKNATNPYRLIGTKYTT